MAKTLPKPVVSAIELAIQIAHSKGIAPDLTNIAAIFNTTYETCTRIRRRLIAFERTGIDPRKRAGPKPLKGANEEQVAMFIRKLVSETPAIDQKSISQALLSEFNVVLGQSTVSRLMKRGGIPHKQSNGWYKRTKLVSTHPDGRVMDLDEEEEDKQYQEEQTQEENQEQMQELTQDERPGEGDSEMCIAAGALSQLPGLGREQGNGEIYSSPYSITNSVRNSSYGNGGPDYRDDNLAEGYS